MPNIKSAIKRVQVSERNRLRNKSYKSAVRTLMKKCFAAAESCATEPTPENVAEANRYLSEATSKIDKAVKRKVYHRNNAARKKARLSKAVKQAETLVTAAE